MAVARLAPISPSPIMAVLLNGAFFCINLSIIYFLPHCHFD
ncbi:hypothetical protein [Moraxella lacunata]